MSVKQEQIQQEVNAAMESIFASDSSLVRQAIQILSKYANVGEDASHYKNLSMDKLLALVNHPEDDAYRDPVISRMVSDLLPVIDFKQRNNLSDEFLPSVKIRVDESSPGSEHPWGEESQDLKRWKD